jgi:hypothetical protein
MPKPRSSGFSRSIRVWSSQMLPLDKVSRPARQFSAVDLPQPDGPSSAMNSPRRTVNVTPLSALTEPKLRLMASSRSSRKSRPAIAMKCPSPMRPVAARPAAHRRPRLRPSQPYFFFFEPISSSQRLKA